MKALTFICMLALIAGVGFGASEYEKRQVAQNSRAAAQVDVDQMRRTVHIDELTITDAELDEQIATQEHRKPDVRATEVARQRLVSDKLLLGLAEDRQEMASR